MPTTADFEAERAFLLRLAYRMLGTVQDAEDVVQDVWLRWQAADRGEIRSARAWLARTCTRLCVDRLRAAERHRQRYPGDWLPEPWIDTDRERRERDDKLSVALLATLQRLSPTERAVFLLHDVFGHAFAEVAAMLDLTPANCRQVAVRARRHLDMPPRAAASAQTLEHLGEAFFAALRAGDVEPLRGLLHEGVVLRTDGGGKVSALRQPLQGRVRLLRFFDRLYVRPRRLAAMVVEPGWWNGAPGFVLRDRDGVAESAFQFVAEGDRIQAIFVQRNPDKLRAFAR